MKKVPTKKPASKSKQTAVKPATPVAKSSEQPKRTDRETSLLYAFAAFYKRVEQIRWEDRNGLRWCRFCGHTESSHAWTDTANEHCAGQAALKVVGSVLETAGANDGQGEAQQAGDSPPATES